MSEKITPRQRRAIESLLTTADKAQAAAAAGVSRNTLYRWLRNPAFKAELDAATGEAIDALSRALVALGDKATATLDGAMSGDDTPITVKVRAADVTLARLLQIRELGALEKRVSDLEKMIGGSR